MVDTHMVLPQGAALDRYRVKWTGNGFFRWDDDADRYYFEILDTAQISTPDGVVVIMPGFYFDGASIPRAGWSIIGSPFTGRYMLAALLHDGLYAAEIVTRARADWMFVDLMSELGAAWWRRNAMYIAVRAGGWMAWRNHTPGSIAEARCRIKLVK